MKFRLGFGGRALGLGLGFVGLECMLGSFRIWVGADLNPVTLNPILLHSFRGICQCGAPVHGVRRRSPHKVLSQGVP